MNEGEILAWIGLAWFIADAILWAKGRPTFSKWVIKNSYESKWFGGVTLAILIWLVLHWELPCALGGWLCWVDV